MWYIFFLGHPIFGHRTISLRNRCCMGGSCIQIHKQGTIYIVGCFLCSYHICNCYCTSKITCSSKLFPFSSDVWIPVVRGLADPMKFGMAAPPPHSSRALGFFILGQVTDLWRHKYTFTRSQNATISQRFRRQAIFLRKMKLSECNKPPGTNMLYISDFFHAGHLRSGQSRDLAHHRPIREYCSG